MFPREDLIEIFEEEAPEDYKGQIRPCYKTVETIKVENNYNAMISRVKKVDERSFFLDPNLIAVILSSDILLLRISLSSLLTCISLLLLLLLFTSLLS